MANKDNRRTIYTKRPEVKPDTKGTWLPFGRPPSPAAMKHEIDEELKSELSTPGEVKHGLNRVIGKTSRRAAMQSQFEGEGMSPPLAAAHVGAAVNARAAEILRARDFDLYWRPDHAHTLAMAEFNRPV